MILLYIIHQFFTIFKYILVKSSTNFICFFILICTINNISETFVK